MYKSNSFVRTIVLLLCVCFLAVCLTSCGDNGPVFNDNAGSKNITGKINFACKDVLFKSEKVSGTSGRADLSLTLNFALEYSKAPISVSQFVTLVKNGYYDYVEADEDKGIEKKAYYVSNYAKSFSFAFDSADADYTIYGEFEENGWDKNDIDFVGGTMFFDILGGAANYDSAYARVGVLFSSNASLKGTKAAFGKITDDLANVTLSIDFQDETDTDIYDYNLVISLSEFITSYVANNEFYIDTIELAGDYESVNLESRYKVTTNDISTTAIALIVVGCVAVIAVIVVLVYVFGFKKKNSNVVKND